MESKLSIPSYISYRSDNPKKEIFIAYYDQLNGHISNTCAAVPIHRDTYYDWLDKDESFRKAVMECEMHLNDDIREALINKAASGDTASIIFYLKKRHPDFKDSPNTLVQVNNFTDHAKNELKEFE